jgi:hypothetical protein
MLSFTYRQRMQPNENIDALPFPSGIPQADTLTPEQLMQNFSQQETVLQQKLTELNREFEEKLATLATKQLMARMTNAQP